MSASIRRHEEAMYVPLAGPPYEVSGEFADNFVADYRPDGNVMGLEILWPDSYRAGSEPSLLAFGIFGAALDGLGWRYNADVNDSDGDVVVSLRKKLETLLNQSSLDLRLSNETPHCHHNGCGKLDLAILDPTGKLLLCADIKRGDFQPEKVAAPIRLLQKTVIPAYPGAVGVCVFVDETGRGHRSPPVEPGRWIDWPEAKLPGRGHVWTHIAVIPPVDCEYPWLPKSFLPSRYEVEVGA